MILYDLKCENGHRFEATLKSMFADNPNCECGARTSRIPSRVNQSGAASAGPSREEMPNTWLGTKKGDRDLIRGWHKAMTKREKLEEKYPELAGDRRPVLAHEGAFAGAPLKAGDTVVHNSSGGSVQNTGSLNGKVSKDSKIISPGTAK